MQERKTIQELAVEIARQAKEKRDFVVPSPKMQMVIEGNAPMIEMPVNGGRERWGINNYANAQIAAKLQIPKPYYDRMMQNAPDLLAQNVNRWLVAQPKTNLVRTLDGNVRAFLSDRYRPLDNDVMFEALYPQLERAGVEIKSCEITPTRLYLQVVSANVQAVVPSRRGEIIQAGLCITNSEVGAARLLFENLLYFLSCLNGAIGKHVFQKQHSGSRLGNPDEIINGMELSAFSDRTRMLDDRTTLSMIEDSAKKALSQLTLDSTVKMLDDSTRRYVPVAAVTDTISEVTKRFMLTEKEGEGVLSRLISGADLTQYGLSAAITNLANSTEEVEDYDRVIELERVGHDLLEANDQLWQEITKKAA
jgi:hypothetical protein